MYIRTHKRSSNKAGTAAAQWYVAIVSGRALLELTARRKQRKCIFFFETLIILTECTKLLCENTRQPGSLRHFVMKLRTAFLLA